MKTWKFYLTQNNVRGIAGKMEGNAHLWRSHAALKPAIPDPMTAIFFPDGDSMAMCVV
jgi:hypothetical protein